MSERPAQLPEGRLISRAQKRARLSGREAARRAEMSEGHWRAIVSGARSISSGVWVPVRGPADTLARMADVVGVTPEDLEEAGRPDAAEELRQLQPEITLDEAEAMLDTNEEMAAELLQRMRRMNQRQRRALIEVARAMDESERSSEGG